MRIVFEKISDARHALTLVRQGGRRERVECETRSYLMHDLLHLAVEGEAGLEGGFWGSLARGRTLAEMNDRSQAMGAEMATIEQIVGALSGIPKGQSSRELVAGMRRFTAALETSLPDWLTEQFVVRVQERMRRLVGHWQATPYGSTMELEWPP